MSEQVEDAVTIILTERQARGVAHLIETGHRVGFRAVTKDGILTEPEMVDLQVRLIRALGEKSS